MTRVPDISLPQLVSAIRRYVRKVPLSSEDFLFWDLFCEAHENASPEPVQPVDFVMLVANFANDILQDRLDTGRLPYVQLTILKLMEAGALYAIIFKSLYNAVRGLNQEYANEILNIYNNMQ